MPMDVVFDGLQVTKKQFAVKGRVLERGMLKLMLVGSWEVPSKCLIEEGAYSKVS